MNILMTKSKEYLEELDIVKIIYLAIIAALTGILIYFFMTVNSLSSRISVMETKAILIEEEQIATSDWITRKSDEAIIRETQLEIIALIKTLLENQNGKKD